MKNKFNSSVLHNGYVYGLDEGILVCLDVNTGERKWKDGRYGYGQVILAGDHLIVTSDQGEVALVKASPDRYTRSRALRGACRARRGIIRRSRADACSCATRTRWRRTTSQENKPQMNTD